MSSQHLRDMWQRLGAWTWAHLLALKPAFFSKEPHFSFITAHYFWIIGMTILASVLIYGPGNGNIAYIDALMFASGANTQAGLNPVDLNAINTWQQVMVYIFAGFSNPIVLHGSVVFFRLYWFEKRFQSVVRDAKQNRLPISKSKSRARANDNRVEEGVKGRAITLVPNNGRSPRLTNDGVVLEDNQGSSKMVAQTDGSDTSTVTTEQSRDNDTALDDLPFATVQSTSSQRSSDRMAPQETNRAPHPRPILSPVPETGGDRIPGTPPMTPTTIQFADRVKRSDGLDIPMSNVSHRPPAEHIAILQRQRNNNDDDVLRIPGPRDAERGVGPTRVQDFGPDEGDDNNGLFPSRTYESRRRTGTANSIYVRGAAHTSSQPAESEGNHHDELVADVKAAGGVIDALRFRKPRFFNKSKKQVHGEDEDEAEADDAAPTRPYRTKSASTFKRVLSRRNTVQEAPYLSYTPTMGRNSNFLGLSLEQREELGGIEYRSLRTLAFVLVIYYWGFQLLALTCLLPYIRLNREYGDLVEADGITDTWWGFWTAHSSFMDLGFTLTPDSMISFQRSEWVLLSMSFFIIIGNTGFPVMLRFVIWATSKVVPKGTGLWEELRFLLDHPRRCFTLLFPTAANWWLFWLLIILTAVDLLFFIVLDLHEPPVSDLPVHTRVVNGLFQAASTRTAGFSAVNIAQLHPAMPILYVVMMYISVFPIAISIRRTNVYEEKSLGVYANKGDDEGPDSNEASARSYVGFHLRSQLSFDLWYVFLGFFVLAIAEGGKLKRKEFSTFDMLFEIVSAYGTVGLSMGTPTTNTSLCAQFSVLGKLVIVAMQIRGRHRGLPYGLDRAVLLPSEGRFEEETEHVEPEFSLARTNTGVSSVSGTSGRQRGRSISRDRNVFAKLMHPGPVASRDAMLVRKRTRSMGSQMRPPTLNYARTEPRSEYQGSSLRPVATTNTYEPPHRAGTTPMM